VLWSIELLFKYERNTGTVTRTMAQFFSNRFADTNPGQGRWSRCARSSSMDANLIMPSGICASIDPSEYKE
jgi:hypothetical protein